MHSWEVVGLVSWNDQSKEPSGVLIFPLQPPTSLLQRQVKELVFCVLCSAISALYRSHLCEGWTMSSIPAGPPSREGVVSLESRTLLQGFPGWLSVKESAC